MAAAAGRAPRFEWGQRPRAAGSQSPPPAAGPGGQSARSERTARVTRGGAGRAARVRRGPGGGRRGGPGGGGSMAAPFEERSGVVPCRTPWGRWYQTLEEVFVEVHVPPGTRAKDVSCSLQSRHLALAVGGRQLLQVAAGGVRAVPAGCRAPPAVPCAAPLCERPGTACGRNFAAERSKRSGDWVSRG